ncbi:alpha/beta hydrolase family esterase [Aquimonas sp.]|jgi:poly(3-hydroxybutyrate) depolymerase|uniref:alpha/beta hydrolase family esterase n=1 Tax=Aquimonas sp. TaxID=1872588 RepID=UPI0037C08187
MRLGLLLNRAQSGRSGRHGSTLRWLLMLPILASAITQAATVPLPAAACRTGDLFVDGFETNTPYSANPSTGGGGVPGDAQRAVLVTSTGQTRTYFLRVPPLHSAARPAPLLVLLHGATGSQATTEAAAQSLRSLFANAADRHGFIVLAAPASGSQGGWLGNQDTAFIAAAITDIEAQYAIDRQRRGLWGFSAGAHFAHGLALDNADFFAAYAIKAGALQAYSSTGAPAAASRRIPLQSRVGLSDSLLSFAQADATRFVNAGWIAEHDLQYREVSGGHNVDDSDADAAAAWLCAWAVTP